MPATIAVLDSSGIIRSVNAAWNAFAAENGMEGAAHGLGTDYLAICDSAATDGVHEAAAVAIGLRAILAGTREDFVLEYPCDSPTIARWFRLKASALGVAADRGVVVMHVEIFGGRHPELSAQGATQRGGEPNQGAGPPARIEPSSGWSVELATGTMTLSPAARASHCLPVEHKMTGQASLEFFTPQDHEMLAELFKRAVSHGVPFDVHAELRPPRAGCVWLRVSGRAERSPSGHALRIGGATQDVTEWHARQPRGSRDGWRRARG